jgi:hypothetical protein
VSLSGSTCVLDRGDKPLPVSYGGVCVSCAPIPDLPDLTLRTGRFDHQRSLTAIDNKDQSC